MEAIEVMSDARDIDLWVTGVQNQQLDPPALQTMSPHTEQLTVVRVSRPRTHIRLHNTVD